MGRPLAERPRRRVSMVSVAAAIAFAGGCSDDDTGVDSSPASAVGNTTLATSVPAATESAGATTSDDGTNAGANQRYPDVVAADAVRDGDTWTFAVTLSSPYDTPERYADAWRVLTPDGTVVGERILAHDHQNEQPFTRSQSGISVPEGVETVIIEGRDLVHGWGGGTLEYRLPGRD